MTHTLQADEQVQLRQKIISQCLWSETYGSLKQILQRTANQLPLLISTAKTSNASADQTIFFFDRMISNKIFFTPMRASDEQAQQYEVYPRHCTFAITDLFKGAFEFVRDGRRCTRIFPNLEQLVDFATNHKCPVIFMSRDRLEAFYSNATSNQWSTKDYPQGALFHAQRIHRSTSAEAHRSDNDYLECVDEESYSVFLSMNRSGRFSLIATSPDQQENQPEIFLHSTQTPNVCQLIKRLNPSNKNSNQCIRLVRGAVPHNFHCQYLQLIRQRTYDILVGLTEEGLVVEWNLDSEAPCRYATNLNEILSKMLGTWEENTLEAYIDQARTHYREDFQFNMQLISTKDWAAFFQYWKWIAEVRPSDQMDESVPYQSRHRFHLVASIQDLSDHAVKLPRLFNKSFAPTASVPLPDPFERSPARKTLTHKQRDFVSQMAKLLSASAHHHKSRVPLNKPRQTSLLAPEDQAPFDNSIYDSNQTSHIARQFTPASNRPKRNSRVTQ